MSNLSRLNSHHKLHSHNKEEKTVEYTPYSLKKHYQFNNMVTFAVTDKGIWAVVA